jgi:hypothetical protein
MNRICIYLIVLVLLASGPAFSATLANRHILVDVDGRTGRLFLSTLDGLEERGDERRHLLFNDSPPSSRFYVGVDDDLYLIGGERGTFSKEPVVIGNYIETIWENETFSVRQVVQWVRREETGVQDGVLVEHEVENRSSRGFSVSLYHIYDTYLGEKQRYHFTLADGERLEYETELSSASLPLWWASLEEDTNVCLRGLLSGDLVSKPSKILFANYRELTRRLYVYRTGSRRRYHSPPNSRHDSAVALMFGPLFLQADELTRFSTILGLCGEGDYVLDSDTSVIQEKAYFTSAAPGDGQGAGREQIEEILSRIADIELIRGSVERMDEIIAELNGALESEAKTISAERLEEIERILQGLTEN